LSNVWLGIAMRIAEKDMRAGSQTVSEIVSVRTVRRR
jgi:hypothetical protein